MESPFPEPNSTIRDSPIQESAVRNEATPSGKPVRVLIVDDSAIVRRVLSDTLAKSPGIEVVGTAPDPYVARNKILSLEPDVITLDIEMPRMDGITFLRRLMRYHPKPVIVISSIATDGSQRAMDALRFGAVDVVPKPGGPYSVGELKEDLPRKIRAAASARLRIVSPESHLARLSSPHGSGGASLVERNEANATDLHYAGEAASTFHRDNTAESVCLPFRRPGAPEWSLIAIGASTGGTQAVEAILRNVPVACPPIVVTQHIPAGFSTSFAHRLNSVCAPSVREAKDGDALVPGVVLVAPGGFHLRVRGKESAMFVRLDDGPKVCYQRPSVDVLFESITDVKLRTAVAVLLTGMGSDGAQGMLALRRNGLHTIAESEETCVVFGMPREAIRLNAAAEVQPLFRIAHSLGYAVERKPV